MAKTKQTPSEEQLLASQAATATQTPPDDEDGEAEESEGEGKSKRQKWQELYATEEAAQEEASSRTKGPRRAFKCELSGQEWFIVANNEGRAGGVAFAQAGGTVTELGAKGRKAKPVGIQGIMEAINALPESERASVLAQLGLPSK